MFFKVDPFVKTAWEHFFTYQAAKVKRSENTVCGGVRSRFPQSTAAGARNWDELLEGDSGASIRNITYLSFDPATSLPALTYPTGV